MGLFCVYHRISIILYCGCYEMDFNEIDLRRGGEKHLLQSLKVCFVQSLFHLKDRDVSSGSAAIRYGSPAEGLAMHTLII